MLIQYIFFSETNRVPSKESRLDLQDKSIEFLIKYREKFSQLEGDESLYYCGVHHRMFYGLKLHLIDGKNQINTPVSFD